MIEYVRVAREFVRRIREFCEFDSFHFLTTGESRGRLALFYAIAPGFWEQTTVYVSSDGAGTSEYASVLDEDPFLREEIEIPCPVLFVWTHRVTVTAFLALHEGAGLAEGLHGRGAWATMKDWGISTTVSPATW